MKKPEKPQPPEPRLVRDWGSEALGIGYAISFIVLLMIIFVGARKVNAQETVDRFWLESSLDYRINLDCPEWFADDIQESAEEISHYARPLFRGSDVTSFTKNSINESTCLDETPFGMPLLLPGENYIDWHFTIEPFGVVATTRSFFLDNGRMLECDIWYDSDWLILSLDDVTLHEWGHCMGEVHVDDELSIMDPSPTVKYIDMNTAIRLVDKYENCGKAYAVQTQEIYIPILNYLQEDNFVILKPNGLIFEVTEFGPPTCQGELE
jgi:hypothetical protein